MDKILKLLELRAVQKQKALSIINRDMHQLQQMRQTLIDESLVATHESFRLSGRENHWKEWQSTRHRELAIEMASKRVQQEKLTGLAARETARFKIVKELTKIKRQSR